MKKLISLAAGTAVLVGTFMTGTAMAASTLDSVKEKGHLQCGVTSGLPGFSQPDDKGNWTGIDVDTCRAIAAAVFGKGSAVEFTPLTAKERFTALQSGEIDVLSRNTTWTLTRDASLGLNFAGVNYYDGQGFLVKKDLGVKDAEELDGATVCIQAGTTTELNLADYFRAKGMKFKPLVFDTSEQTVQGFAAGRCDVLTSDRSQLAALRSKLTDPNSAIILPNTISKEPLGPVVRQGDDQWFNIVKWVLSVQINAEELGVTMDNVDDMKKSDNPNIQRLLGTDGDMGEKLGLPADFGYKVVKEVGNYGEMYDRNVGPDTPLGLDRGINALWNDGGILYAPPVR
ncbi:MAG: amino acid ABC transporter substrate-binding protein [Alteromonadaceae bacterium]|uniref:amino acid ABC transporter substrate-binding protein n=1 Tax=unclassified Marinobacter TaxID=83889 RepID=UPI000C4A21DE|nr:amino acid ABC transporter substrate-binding protein [Marinobacter sp. BGYM27]MAA65421.1 amino acid ABC transporter substrate-binding protein [Alteromonadaceae bacterium]MBH85087.1 amino acid ABC transporter substrate-binding protein [Alteromonadaceae bacterium]MDG5500118.1 amino acid ABC transporter substrate-binding protein [Marinobacter sp. BGYM27]|tara:strand:- start:15616 stop:16641 length:1026 start_codon:yes stop_codon:yes gene_type:complete